MLGLALRSLWNRRFVAALSVLSIALSVALILGVERLRGEARDSFANSAAGIDLIVAPRGNAVQILMATVFGVGTTGTGLAWESYELVEDLPQVAWSVPIQMGDNHRGYPVIGTTAAYFERFRHSGGQPLVLAKGQAFDDAMPEAAVVGAEIAARFGYGIGTVIVNAHGAGAVSFDLHDDAPFTVIGVLAPTGTAVDRMVFVTLEGFDEIHAARTPPPVDPFNMADGDGAAPGAAAPEVRKDHHDDAETHDDARDAYGHEGEERHTEEEHDHEDERSLEGKEGNAEEEQAHEEARSHAEDQHGRAEDDHGAGDPHGDHRHKPAAINAIYVGLTDRTAVLGIQRTLAELRMDAVSAVIPAVALTELWSITGTAERAMQLMAWAVALAGMTGMVVMLSATLEARRREFAILRSVGATPARIFALIIAEAALLVAAGLAAGLLVLALAVRFTAPILTARFGLTLDTAPADGREVALLAGILAAGLVAALVPALRVYRMTLVDGLSVRL